MSKTVSLSDHRVLDAAVVCSASFRGVLLNRTSSFVLPWLVCHEQDARRNDLEERRGRARLLLWNWGYRKWSPFPT
ncbi:hypothetical protein CEXT_162731 [Caerostris extrusa]|uniref:Uncharacterized protein n=1 Tax=Caerostris extrusa TaxID=172846 RepID=A0AAV4QSK3_CAEEX|nr:hypothetical protein CEXT_162731 [Caerostris extrusa]